MWANIAGAVLVMCLLLLIMPTGIIAEYGGFAEYFKKSDCHIGCIDGEAESLLFGRSIVNDNEIIECVNGRSGRQNEIRLLKLLLLLDSEWV
ncbi:hypothetical protein LVJ83_05100 [Uruburuella testudinis]|uniref:Uncharacterized protein n=1 Tax=Uruburuella testudinis TaxID=1282863 RepID=A0ABY4DXN9_9NEIS|nr:hypothetical protein [Uruburuella testudinis]UOO82839.1 hypothetical protein LVJ83_05100 [Uruburuella testudinis]